MLAYLSADIACSKELQGLTLFQFFEIIESFILKISSAALERNNFQTAHPRKLTLRFFIKEDVSPLKPGVRALQSATPTIPGSPIGMFVCFFFVFFLWRCNIQF